MEQIPQKPTGTWIARTSLTLSAIAILFLIIEHFQNKKQFDKLSTPMIRVDNIVIDSSDGSDKYKVQIYMSNYSHTWAYDVKVFLARLALPRDTINEFLILPRDTKYGTMPTNSQIIINGSMEKAVFALINRKETYVILIINMDYTNKDKTIFQQSFSALYNYEHKKFLVGNGSLFEER